MSAHCHHDHTDTSPSASADPRYRRVLWAALVVNAVMFGVELSAGFAAGSVSLLADAIDFLGDAANYGVSLLVLTMAVAWRARAAMLKSASMVLFGLFVAARAVWALAYGAPPQAATMGTVGMLALVANVGVAVMLYAWRDGDANMRSVWLCTRNDALGNLAVMVAALGVFGTGRAWPDLAVAGVMSVLAITAGASVMRQARRELAWDGHGR
ncbi:MAG: cation transporter [Ramlibacter sp.]|jgi:Co/Zn/Cd efflux system component|nr:cation transporter [Ramlibacter sp.]